MRGGRAVSRRGRLLIGLLVALALPLLLSQPASAQGSIHDNGWYCYRGGLTFNFPQVYLNNRNVVNEGVHLQVVVYRDVNGRWDPYTSTQVTGVTSRFGMTHTALYGTWLQAGSNRSMVKYSVGLPPGRYVVGVLYRWDSTDWGSYISGVNKNPNVITCQIPK